MIMPKNEFCELMREIEQSTKTTSQITSLVRDDPILKDTADFFDSYSLLACMTPVANKLLKYMFDDEDDYIEYWMYELSYGHEWRPGCVRDEKGEDIKLQTAEDLYDFLVNEMLNTETTNDNP